MPTKRVRWNVIVTTSDFDGYGKETETRSFYSRRRAQEYARQREHQPRSAGDYIATAEVVRAASRVYPVRLRRHAACPRGFLARCERLRSKAARKQCRRQLKKKCDTRVWN